MLSLSDSTGRNSEGPASSHYGDFTSPDGRKINEQSIIDQANSIPILYLFKEFDINLDQYNVKTRCPFHKGGNERSESFYFYSESNRFHCFGCSKTGSCVELYCLAKQVSKIVAAVSILEKFGGFINSEHEILGAKSVFSNDAVIEFSNIIRKFIKLHQNSAAVSFAEKLSYTFDSINARHVLDHNALTKLINKLKIRLENYHG